VLARALEHVRFTVDPVAGAFEEVLANGVAAGTAKDGSIDGLFALGILNEVLEGRGEPAVSAAGLGTD
jgi:NitT/TauT family transport system substrate-binding protein